MLQAHSIPSRPRFPHMRPLTLATLVGASLASAACHRSDAAQKPGASAEEVKRAIERWKVVTVYTAAEEVNLQVMGSNRLTIFQMSVLRVLLMLIAGIVIGQLIYTFTLDKVKVIATLKLLGAKNSRIKGMILQQAILMGILGMTIGAVLEQVSQPFFPRRVDASYGDIALTLAAVIVLSVLASLMAIRRAMKVDARSVLGV